MSIIAETGEKNSKIENEKDTHSTNQDEQEQMLTPWQQENLRYRKSQGDEPEWYFKEDLDKKTQSDRTDPESDEEPRESDRREETSDDFLEEPPMDPELAEKERKRKRKLARRLTILINFFTVSALIITYFLSPLCELYKIKVTGNKNVSSEKIITDSKFQLGGDLWEQYFKRKTAENLIEKENMIVKKATVHFSLLNNFSIRIQEHEKVAYMLKEGKYYPILDNAETLQEPISQPSGSVLILSDFTDKQKLKEVIQVYNELPSEIKTSISDIAYKPKASNPFLVTLNMNDGNQVIASLKDLKEKIIYYPQVIKDMDYKGVIDMEAGIYSYKYPSTDASTEDSGGESSSIENFNE